MLNHQDLGRAGGTVQWHGQGGVMLQDLPRLVENRLRYNRRAPALVIVHLGTNNLGLNDACQCRIAIDMALQRTAMPCTHIAWSTIIPRLFYYNSRGHWTSQDAMDGVRKSLNKYARRLITRRPNASVIAHQLDPSNHSLFLRDEVHPGLPTKIRNFLLFHLLMEYFIIWPSAGKQLEAIYKIERYAISYSSKPSFHSQPTSLNSWCRRIIKCFSGETGVLDYIFLLS